VPWPQDASLEQVLKAADVDTIALPYLPTGWTRDALMPHLQPLIESQCAHPFLSDLDRATWPHAKAGFFGVKKQIERILRELGVTGTSAVPAL